MPPHWWRGAAARPEIAKFFITGATARPHHLNGASARLKRPRSELGHSRPKLPSCMARSRPLLGASARWLWCVRALALGALGLASRRAARPRPSNRAPTRAHFSHFWAPNRLARPHHGHGAPAR
ncbi:hypothetical protein PIB30_060332 [Stylosanthes scabra]|uniref:Uncharacterized protein n=1 Tax=Stylosanthes scabra TaxID=79078 RepID=A0ABU6WKK4_9FABA|nr:hypothetical protein [Stylosanthes scabra]